MITTTSIEPWVLLLIGMTTVFLVLFLIILCGNILIRISNYFTSTSEDDKSGDISEGDLQLIEKIVKEWSGGEASIKAIEKMKS